MTSRVVTVVGVVEMDVMNAAETRLSEIDGSSVLLSTLSMLPSWPNSTKIVGKSNLGSVSALTANSGKATAVIALTLIKSDLL